MTIHPLYHSSSMSFLWEIACTVQSLVQSQADLTLSLKKSTSSNETAAAKQVSKIFVQLCSFHKTNLAFCLVGAYNIEPEPHYSRVMAQII